MKKHARLAASAAHRWAYCHGSTALIERLALGSSDSEPAAEGTFAHYIAEICLRENRDPLEWLGNITLVSGFTIECDMEMVEGIQVYLDYVRGLPGIRGYELDLTPYLVGIHPDLGGMMDAAVVDKDAKVATFIDFKYGAGVFVPAKDNLQLMQYAVGGLRGLQIPDDYTIRLVIVQPRLEIGDSPIRTHDYTVQEIQSHIVDLVEAAHANVADAALTPSEQACKWCPAAAHCPALQAMQNTLVEAVQPVNGHLLATPEEISRALDLVPMVKERLSALLSHAYNMAQAGQQIPGYKLVDKRPRRKWADPAQVEMTAPPEWFARVLMTPPALEKKLGKAAFKVYVDLVVKMSSGATLVKESDARQAFIADRAADFSVLSDAENLDTFSL